MQLPCEQLHLSNVKQRLMRANLIGSFRRRYKLNNNAVVQIH